MTTTATHTPQQLDQLAEALDTGRITFRGLLRDHGLRYSDLRETFARRDAEAEANGVTWTVGPARSTWIVGAGEQVPAEELADVDPLAAVRVGDEDPHAFVALDGFPCLASLDGIGQCDREAHADAWQHIAGTGSGVVAVWGGPHAAPVVMADHAG